MLFDGVSEFMKCATFPLEQPTQIYIVFKQITWSSSDKVFDGNINNAGALYQSILTPTIRTSAGADSNYDDKLVLDTWGIVRVLFSGASSELIINEETTITGDSGLNDMDGFTLGASGGNISWGNIEVKEVILRSIADTPTNELVIYNYLKDKYSLPI